MSALKITVFAATILLISLSCVERDSAQKGSPEYITEIEQWHNKRIERLKADNGWLNLVGLYWLNEGENSFGSSEENDIQFPSTSPSMIGKIILKDSTVIFKSSEKANVRIDGQIVTESVLKEDITGKPTIMELGSLRWFIIKRDDRYGIRLRDLESTLVKEFEGIERFAVNDEWRIEADYEAYNPPKIISVPNILGTVSEERSPGKIIFEKDEKSYYLDAVDDVENLFFVFADKTSGEDTYGGGRFLYTDKADSNGIVVVDFNKAYNPPCVFTKYATCPLPPEQNYLKLKITSGEKNWGEH
jgi:uncharacterized protein (DUF1684 family)